MAVDPSCFCGAPSEELKHLFFYCPLAENLFLLLHTFPSLKVGYVLFGFNPDERRVVPKGISLVLHVMKHRIWIARNDFRFHGIQQSFHDNLHSVFACLHFSLGLFSKKFLKSEHQQHLFNRQWLLHGRLGCLSAVSPTNSGEYFNLFTSVFLLTSSLAQGVHIALCVPWLPVIS